MIDARRLAFVGGLHRSGTTALARALSDHHAVSGLTATGVKEDEGQHLQNVYPAANQHGGAGRFASSPEAHLTETSALVSKVNAARLLQAWEPYWDLSRAVLVEKSPPNLLMTRYLQALFPGSAHIVVIRHPIVVALSTKKWAQGTSLHQLVAHNIRAYQMFQSDHASLERVHVLRYEDLVADPECELSKVGRLLDLELPMPTQAIKAGHSTRYEQAWEGYAKGTLPKRRSRRLIERSSQDFLEAMGYRSDDLAHLGPWAGWH